MLGCIFEIIRCILAQSATAGARGCAPRPRVDNPAVLQRPRAKPARLGNTAVNTSPLPISQPNPKTHGTDMTTSPTAWILFLYKQTMNVILGA